MYGKTDTRTDRQTNLVGEISWNGEGAGEDTRWYRSIVWRISCVCMHVCEYMWVTYMYVYSMRMHTHADTSVLCDSSPVYVCICVGVCV
jgi:hypothetical protein